ncbi:MAG: iron-containing alcohol dehydrogenase [Eubacteriales bacterium]|jgi:alcohol dehydrogenase YqhD (iron-dependent ADH family)|nr:iron-containing alcohol dehydrogenase [Eubacteriales bacterium]MDD3611532.1 iron-containing alcohol dehydrogenase [Eubacteriales bacterium]
MKNFTYYTPSKIVFGKDTEEQVGQLVKDSGATKVLLHYGGESAKRSGLLDRVKDSLSAAGIEFLELGGVVPNPRMSLAYQGIELCKKEGVDFILPVGGGSVIDSAKCIAYGAVYDGDVWDFYSRKATAVDALPVGTILTLAATGSEMSDSSVMTLEEGWLKRGYNNDLSRPLFSILNPELTYTLPEYQTACGVVDIMMHTMERYFNHTSDSQLTDAISEALLRTVLDFGPVVMADPKNYNARAQIMWAGCLSHNGLTGAGVDTDWSTHQLEHELGGLFDVAHGAGLSAVWGSWARYVYTEDPRRFAQFAVNVMGVSNDFRNEEATALAGISKLEEFFQSINMPISISDLGIELSDAEIDELAYKCCFMGKRTIGGFKKLDQDDMAEIFRMAR